MRVLLAVLLLIFGVLCAAQECNSVQGDSCQVESRLSNEKLCEKELVELRGYVNELANTLEREVQDRHRLSQACTSELANVEERRKELQLREEALRNALSTAIQSRESADTRSASFARELSDREEQLAVLRESLLSEQRRLVEGLQKKEHLVSELHKRDESLAEATKDLHSCYRALEGMDHRLHQTGDVAAVPESLNKDLEAELRESRHREGKLAEEIAAQRLVIADLSSEIHGMDAEVKMLREVAKIAQAEAQFHRESTKSEPSKPAPTSDSSEVEALRTKLRAKSEHLESVIAELEKEKKAHKEVLGQWQKTLQENSALGDNIVQAHSQRIALEKSLDEALYQVKTCKQ